MAQVNERVNFLAPFSLHVAPLFETLLRTKSNEDSPRDAVAITLNLRGKDLVGVSRRRGNF